MKVTEIRFSGEARGEFLSFVAIVLESEFAIKGLKLVRSKDDPKRVMLCMPDRKRPDGSFADIAHPIDARFRRELEAAVMAAWAQRQGAAA